MRAYLGRRYRLSASHRLHAESLSEAENRAAFGKCNNPFGHGHNYVVEVIVGGEVDSVTGMVCDLVKLDACVNTEIVERFDHTNLNTFERFEKEVPTTENLNLEVYRLLSHAVDRGALGKAELVSVRIEETSNNSFEYPVARERKAGAE
ncbi:6-carboxytetrahydropterin synthase [Silvibacterium acidisoli]|uniref:6-carboxytetrahydropterin synthase n=1 Tax=Acidobacteriaceae bacterium ZG23-2 TaxID=2883246 RepID=UPI00406CD549